MCLTKLYRTNFTSECWLFITVAGLVLDNQWVTPTFGTESSYVSYHISLQKEGRFLFICFILHLQSNI